jgi:hypothetical protein
MRFTAACQPPRPSRPDGNFSPGAERVLNKRRNAEVKIRRKDVRAVVSKWKGRNSLLARDADDEIDLHRNKIYFSRAPSVFPADPRTEQPRSSAARFANQARDARRPGFQMESLALTGREQAAATC